MMMMMTMMVVKEEKMEMEMVLVNVPMTSVTSSVMSDILSPNLNPNPSSANLSPDPYNQCLDQLGGPTKSPSVNSAKSPNTPK